MINYLSVLKKISQRSFREFQAGDKSQEPVLEKFSGNSQFWKLLPFVTWGVGVSFDLHLLIFLNLELAIFGLVGTRSNSKT